MGKGQRKEEKVKQELGCADYKYVEQKNPEAVKFLTPWVNEFWFDGRLKTDSITQLRQAIKDRE